MDEITIELPAGSSLSDRQRGTIMFKEARVLHVNAPVVKINGQLIHAGKPGQPLPFDLEAAKAGAPLVTRDGRRARFLGHIPEAPLPDYRVVAFIEGNGGATNHFENGRLLQSERAGDLFMAPKPKRTVWLNVYPAMLMNGHETEAKAIAGAGKERITTVPVEIDA